MGTLSQNHKWVGVRINGDISNGIAKGGEVIWKLIRIFGGLTSTMPTTGENIRTTIPTFNEVGTFTITANGVDKNYVVAVPEFITLVKIISSNNETLYDRDNISSSNFKLSTTITSIPDNSGVSMPYKVYTFNSILPYSSGVILTITTE